MQYGTGRAAPRDLYMEERFGGWPPGGSTPHAAGFVALQDVGGTQRAFRQRARRDSEAQGRARHDEAEIPARPQYPAAPVKPSSDGRKIARGAGE